MKKNQKLVVLCLFVLLLSASIGLMLYSNDASAQVAPRIAKMELKIIPGVAEKKITVPSVMLNRFKTEKHKANVQVLKNSYVMKNNIPFIKLRGGQEYALLPLSKMNDIPNAVQKNKANQIITVTHARRVRSQ